MMTIILVSYTPPTIPLLSILLNQPLECRRVGANELIDLLAALEYQESRHGADAKLHAELGNVVDVELGEVNAAVLVGPLADDGRDHLARTAPLGKGVEDDNVVVREGRLEVGRAGDLVDTHLWYCCGEASS
jgi:hypothetical protein